MNQKQSNHKPLLNRTSRAGGQTVAVTLILLAVLVVINLLVGALPAHIVRPDLTSSGLYTTGATTENYIRSLSSDLTIYRVTQSPNSTGMQTINRLLERYSSLSSHIKVETVDPVADPTFLETHSAITTSGDYLVVESQYRYTAINVSDLNYVYINPINYSLSVAEYESVMSDPTVLAAYAQQGIDLTDITVYFSGEQQLTAAIEYVSLETIPHVYLLSGNGEVALSADIEEMLQLVMIEYESLTLQGDDVTVPEDASMVVIHAPTHDLTDGATAALSAYLSEGGRILMITSPDNVTMPNLMSLCAQMGAAPTNGVLHEGNANQYVGNATVLKPKPNTQHTVPYYVYYNGMSLIMPRSHGILINETLPENVKATTLLAASDAYTVADDGTETDYGAAALGVELTNSETGAALMWYASADAFSAAAADTYGQAGTYFFALSVSQLDPGYTSQMLSAIEAVDITEQPLNISALTGLVIGVILALGIPTVIVIGGVVVWARRRKR